MRFAHISFLFIALCAAVYAQPPRPIDVISSAAVEDVYLARDDGEGKAGDITLIFATTDIPIHCIVVLAKADPAAVLMNFVAVKVGGVKPDSRIVSSSFATQQGQNRVFFTGRPHGKWTVGSYRIDVFVNDKLEKSLDFEVKSGALPAASNFAPPSRAPRKPIKRN
ncbi:MAG: hypothetical protein PSX80_15165 [bacterium]|nr:hypothetical protein [bacterium]